MSTKFFAQLISRVFGPFSVVPLFFIYLLIFHTGLLSHQQWQLFPILLLYVFCVPVLGFIFFRLTGRISDIDVTNQKERFPLLVLILISGCFGTGLSYVGGAPVLFILSLFFVMLVLSVVSVITPFEKVSLHATMATTLYLIVISLLGESFWWLLIFILLICWSRWYLKKHTIFQLILGIAVPSLIFLTGLVFVLQ